MRSGEIRVGREPVGHEAGEYTESGSTPAPSKEAGFYGR